jgi:hypothetical protein
MNVRANQQRLLWEFVEMARAELVDQRNGRGPFHLQEGEEVSRHLECRNYESCLDFAANNRWPSFSCENCHRASHGVFV